MKRTLTLLLPLLTGASAAGQPASLNPDADFHGKIGYSLQDSVPEWPKSPKAPAGAPNIVLVLIDDLGYSATDLFGGAIKTPAFDQLAARGLRYNNFHTSAMCSPTRAALLSGRNDHRTGFGQIEEHARGFPGYNGIWKKSTVMFADVLRRNGYSTAAFGKWHNTPENEVSPAGPFNHWPTGLGFDYFYGFMSYGTDQWEPMLFRNTAPVQAWGTPQQGYSLDTDLADDAIRWVRTHRSVVPDKPYFLYFATGATHEPHQVPKKWIEMYRGKFDGGWDQLRAETFARQKRLGIIPADAELTPRPKEQPAWDSFSPEARKLMSRQMEVFAGYMSQTDYEVGRLIQEAQSGPGGDNTLILYIAGDNGGSAEGGFTGHDGPGTIKERLDHIDDLGSEEYMNHYASGWAYATSTPFQWMKKIASHYGGTTDPLLISWPIRIKDRGGLRGQFGHVNDVAATIYQVTGIPLPDEVDGVKQVPLDGTSLAYTFEHPDAPSEHRLQIFEQYGNRAIYRDGWIAAARHSLPSGVPLREGFADDRWELYHVATDFSEAHDLAAQDPAKLNDLKRLFDQEARNNEIYPLNVPDARESVPAPKGETVYYPGMPRMGSKSFAQSHRITADVVIPDGGAEGVLLSNGGRFGGFVLYVKDAHLVYENLAPDRHRIVLTSRDTLSPGPAELAFEFVQAPEAQSLSGTDRLYINGRPEAAAKLSKFTASGGTGRLYINGRLEAAAKFSKFTGGGYGALTIGEALVSPVSPNYTLPFAFSGKLNWVRVEMR